MADRELKRCPFCGGIASIETQYPNPPIYRVHCSSCYCGTDGKINKDKAIDLWNSRVETHASMTDLFDKGYRIFVHPNAHDRFEITLGKCERTGREIKRSHCLWKMILAGEFDINSTSSSSSSVCDSCRYKDCGDEYSKVCRDCMRGEDWIDCKF